FLPRRPTRVNIHRTSSRAVGAGRARPEVASIREQTARRRSYRDGTGGPGRAFDIQDRRHLPCTSTRTSTSTATATATTTTQRPTPTARTSSSTTTTTATSTPSPTTTTTTA